MLARLRRGVRLAGGAVLGMLVAGAVAGLWARLAMYVIRLMNDSHNGEVTHANAAVGRVTLEGTLGVVTEGMFVSAAGVFVYLLVRRWLPRGPETKGLVFGLGFLAVALPALVDSDAYEYTRYVGAAVSVPLFALVFPLYGVVLGSVVERVGGGRVTPLRNRVVRVAGRVALLALVVIRLAGTVRELRLDF